MTTRCPRDEWQPGFCNEQTKRVANNDVRTPEARTRPDSASFFSPLSPRIMIMLVFSPTPRQRDEGWVGRRADSAATLGESRRAEKHRGGDTTRVSHTSSRTWLVGWNTGDWSAYHPPHFLLVDGAPSDRHPRSLPRLLSFTRLDSLSVFYCVVFLSLSMIEIIFQSPDNPVVSARTLQAIWQRSYVNLLACMKYWRPKIETKNMKTSGVFNVNFEKQVA